MRRSIFSLALLAAVAACGSPTGAEPGGARFSGFIGSGSRAGPDAETTDAERGGQIVGSGGAVPVYSGYFGSGNVIGGDTTQTDNGDGRDGVIGSGGRAGASATENGYLGSGNEEDGAAIIGTGARLSQIVGSGARAPDAEPADSTPGAVMGSGN